MRRVTSKEIKVSRGGC